MTGILRKCWSGRTLPSADDGRALRILLLVYGFVLLALIVIQVMFTNRAIHADEDGLYNAIYMYQHYGKVTYPMQLQPDYMTIHPPAHYFVVGVLTRLGLQVFHAAGVPLVAMAVVSFCAILSSRFSLIAKMSAMTGFALATLVFIPPTTIRPDIHATFAWFCGLMLLESARSLDWENKRLCLGSFFVAYASGMHYWAGVTALVIPAYYLYLRTAAQRWWRYSPGGTPGFLPAGRRQWVKLSVMAAGALAFYLPYAVFFLIPDYRAIREMLQAANATGGGVAEAIRSQVVQLRGIDTEWPVGFPSIGKWVSYPLKELHLLPAALAIPVLYGCRSLRGFALAGAVLPLFVATAVSRKGGLFYIAPELTLYSVAVSLLLFASLRFAWQFTRRRAVPAWYAMALLATVVLVRAAPASKYGMTWRLDDWDVARAANRRILGEDALVAINQCNHWYSCGARRLYWVVTPIGWDFLARADRDRHFDSIIVINDWFANEGDVIPFPEFYVEGKLNLRGFYFSGLLATDGPEVDGTLDMLHLTTRSDIRRQGFAHDRQRGTLKHYIEDPQGEWVFVTMKTFLLYPEEWPKNAAHLKRFDMDRPVGREPGLFAFVMGRDAWIRARQKYASSAHIRDEIPMTMNEVPVAEVLRNGGDSPIEFTTNLSGVR